MNFPFRGSHLRPRMKSVVISVDGACPGNHRRDNVRRAAWAVYFGPDSAYNQCAMLNDTEEHTSNRAELQAIYHALLAFQLRSDLDGWREVIIKTDSDYAKKTFNENIWKWLENGWTKMDGGAIKHLALIQDIHRMICDIEENGAVRFWRVGREWNEDADALANQALRSN